jgi:integrase
VARKRLGRRAGGEGSLSFNATKGLWAAILSLPPGADGRRRRRTRYSATQQGALAALAELHADAKLGRLDIDPARITVDQWLSQYVALGDRRPSTQRTYTALLAHARGPLGGVQLSKVSKLHLRRWLADLEVAEVPAPTRAMAFKVLRAALREAVRLDLIPRDPSDGLTAPRLPVREKKVLDAEQLAKLLGAADADGRVGALVVLLATTGLRLGEALALRWRDIDLKGGSLRVEHTLLDIGTTPTLQAPKTARSRRSVSLSPRCLAALERHRTRLGALPHRDLLVFNKGGRPLSRDQIYAPWFRFLKALELPRVTPHSLRHSHATALLRGGVPVHTVSARLGHASPNITLGVYSHALPGDDAALAARVDALLS